MWYVFLLKMGRKFLQSAVNTEDEPFSGPLAYGVLSPTLKASEVPYWPKQSRYPLCLRQKNQDDGHLTEAQEEMKQRIHNLDRHAFVRRVFVLGVHGMVFCKSQFLDPLHLCIHFIASYISHFMHLGDKLHVVIRRTNVGILSQSSDSYNIGGFVDAFQIREEIVGSASASHKGRQWSKCLVRLSFL